MTALPPIVSLLAAFGANVPPPATPNADFLAILAAAEGTSAEETAPGPTPDDATPQFPNPEGRKLPGEKPKKDVPGEAPSLPWAVSIPAPAPQEAPAPPPTLELSPAAPPEPTEQDEPALPQPGLEPVAGRIVTPAVADPKEVTVEERLQRPAEETSLGPLGTSIPRKVQAVEPAAATSPVAGPQEVTPAGPKPQPPATPTPQAPESEIPPATDQVTAPAPKPQPSSADVPPPPPVEAAPPAPGPQSPIAVVAPLLVEATPQPLPKETEPTGQQPSQVRSAKSLAFSARLVSASPSPKQVDTKVPAATASAAAPETERRPAPHAPEEPKARAAVHAPEDADVASDAPREQPAVNAPAPRDIRTQDAPERAEAPARTDAPKPAVHAAAAPAETPKASPFARDIRLEVAGAERKVELRVIERAGEVQIAVRTPDEGLAGTLREHLPLLSSRLEQSGFRADQWRAADAGGTERPLDVQAAAESSGRAPEHRGGNEQQRQQQERQPAQPAEERKKSQEKGKAFEWLMQSLR